MPKAYPVSNEMDKLMYFLFFLLGTGVSAIILRGRIFDKKPCPEQETRIDGETIHQLRGFLTTIHWVFEKLVEDGLSPVHKEVAEHGKRMTEDSINLINNTLDAIREGSKGKMKFKMELNNINQVVEDIMAEYTLLAKDRKLDLKFEKPEHPIPSFFFDRSQMYLALHDLVYNAIKYTPDGGSIIINITEDKGHLKLTIKDTGIGVPRAQIKRLFSKFFRADNAQKIRGDGHGLGLYIVKSIISRHNGKIEVESEEGKGSTFKITLPLSQV